jgi:hypothetical protein
MCLCCVTIALHVRILQSTLELAGEEDGTGDQSLKKASLFVAEHFLPELKSKESG